MTEEKSTSHSEFGLSAQDAETAKSNGYVAKTSKPYFWQKRTLKITVKGWHYCCCFALAGVMSGQFVGYNPGLAAGVAGFTLCLILISIAYVVLAACIGELASAIPFCGGSYGYTRFVFGKVPGYIIGVIESLEYFFLVTTLGYFAGELVSLFTGLSDDFLPLWWAIIYSITCYLLIRGGKLMWDIVNVVCVFNIIVLIIFFLATTKWMNMKENAAIPGPSPWFTTDSSVWFQSFPYAMWMFIGVEVLPMMSEEVEEPHKNVPKGIRAAVWILSICSFFIMLNVASLPPPDHGTLVDTSHSLFPCQQGWALVFRKDSNQSVLLSFLPILNSLYSLAIGASRQMFAMSRSGYLPSRLSLTTEGGVPYVSTTLILFSCFILSIIIGFSPNPTRFFNALFNVSTITGISNYLVQLSCFIVWRTKHKAIRRQYSSPYGIPGAILGILIFGVGLGSMFAFTPNVSDAIITIIVFLVIALTYYIVYARFHLTLSPEEIHALFPVYSFRIIENKWKKTHKRESGAGYSLTKSAKKPKSGVELDNLSNSRAGKEIPPEEASSRPLFNPYALDKQDSERTLKQPSPTATPTMRTPQTPSTRFQFDSPVTELRELPFDRQTSDPKELDPETPTKEAVLEQA